MLPRNKAIAVGDLLSQGCETSESALQTVLSQRFSTQMIALTVVFRHSAHQIALRAGHHGAMYGVILPQSPVAPFGLTVRDLVAQGRYPYQNWLQQWSAKDEKIVQQALLITDLLELADRALDTLSGEPHGRSAAMTRSARPKAIALVDSCTTY